jgi:glycosyltransferase involved in cell wall biosynthesis
VSRVREIDAENPVAGNRVPAQVAMNIGCEGEPRLESSLADIANRRTPVDRSVLGGNVPGLDGRPHGQYRMTPLSPLTGQGRRPRIGVDFHSFDGPYQGSRSHLLGLYRDAVRRAPEYDFVFFCADAARLREADPAFALPNAQCVAMPHRSGVARLGWQLALLQRKHRIDLLHVQYRMPLIPFGACAVTIHDTLFETHPQFFATDFLHAARFAGRRAVRQAALLLTVSEFSRQEIARLYDVDPQRITITGNGVNLARFHPTATDASQEWDGADLVRALGAEPGQYLISVGRLEPRKNHLNLVRAFARIAEPRPQLLIVGQRDLEHDEVFAEVEALGLAKEILFLERVADAELPALIRHACVFVYPSFAEGFGMPVLEAMASGVAVVTSNTTALGELSAGAALAVDPNDPATIAAAIECLLFDGALRRRLAAAGLEVAARHRWSTAAKALLAAYRRFFAGHPAT